MAPGSMELLKNLNNPIVEKDSGLRFGNLDYDSFNMFDVQVKLDKLEIYGVDGQYSKVSFLLPTKMHSIHPLLEERVRQGISIVKNSLLHGTVEVKFNSLSLTLPALCWDYALRAHEEWKKLSNTACTVSLQQKNVYQKHSNQ